MRIRIIPVGIVAAAAALAVLSPSAMADPPWTTNIRPVLGAAASDPFDEEFEDLEADVGDLMGRRIFDPTAPNIEYLQGAIEDEGQYVWHSFKMDPTDVLNGGSSDTTLTNFFNDVWDQLDDSADEDIVFYTTLWHEPENNIECPSGITEPCFTKSDWRSANKYVAEMIDDLGYESKIKSYICLMAYTWTEDADRNPSSYYTSGMQAAGIETVAVDVYQTRNDHYTTSWDERVELLTEDIIENWHADIAVTEYGAPENGDDGAAKADWLDDAYDWAVDVGALAMLYFNNPDGDISNGDDYLLQCDKSSEAVCEEFAQQNVISKDYFDWAPPPPLAP